MTTHSTPTCGMSDELETIPRTLSVLEGVVERGLQTFVEVGMALLEIRERRLYREAGFSEFNDYCRARWKWSEAHATRHIQAAAVAQALPMGNGPTNERQARELVPLLVDKGELVPLLVDKGEQEVVELWRELQAKPDTTVTASRIRSLVSKRLELGRPQSEVEQRIRKGERLALEARHEFGSKLLKERRANGQLPPGRLEEISRATGVSPGEIRYRAKFAELYPTMSDAADTFRTWDEFTYRVSSYVA